MIMRQVLFLGLILTAEGWLSSQPTKLNRLRKSTFHSSAASDNNNIILAPSYDDPDAFDSLKIGSARVHRYSREYDPEGAVEYVMWYHGRNKDLDSDKSLPPLSTGRIGRATSLNGLHWVKDDKGSEAEEEDMEGINLGLNKDSWWGFDTAHVGLGNVLLPMSTPAVMTEGGVYLMYFMGGNFEETPVKDYLEKCPPSMEDATIKGMKMKIGVALSQDGISWGRVEGDDPSGACMVPYDAKDPNMASMVDRKKNDGSPVIMEEELYCAWPEVAVQIGANKKGAAERSGFFMYYSTMTREEKEKCIAYAVSEDGFRWLKRGVCLRPDEDGLDAGGCARCCVVKDAEYDEESGSWTEINKWKMYYEGVSKEDGKHRIMWAVSEDGDNWEKQGLAFDVGEDDDWDCGGVGAPHIIRMDDGTERMYYTGQGKDGSTAIGVAKLMNKSAEWKREQTTVTFA